MNTKDTITKNSNIQKLWNLLPKDGSRTDFLKMLAKDVDRSPSTLRNHWFANFWLVPKEFEDRVIFLLQNTIREKGIEIEAA